MFTSLIKAFVNFSFEDEIVFADERIVAGNDHGLLPWRTSNLVNVRRPSGVTYFKTPRGRAEPWQQTDVIGMARLIAVKGVGKFSRSTFRSLLFPSTMLENGNPNILCARWHCHIPLGNDT
jgi:hypothetical protein